MKARAKFLNWYQSTIQFGSSIPATGTSGTFSVTDKSVDGNILADGTYSFWVVVDARNAATREIFRIVDVSGNVLTYDRRVSPQGMQEHLAGIAVQVNDVAEIHNWASANSDDFGFVEKASQGTTLNVKCYGGKCEVAGVPTDVSDQTVALSGSSSGYLVFDRSDRTFKSWSGATPPATHFLCAQFVTSVTDVTTLTDVRPAVSQLWDAPADATEYVRRNNQWVPNTGGAGVAEAPNDGSAYSRKNLGWEKSGKTLVSATDTAQEYLDDKLGVTGSGISKAKTGTGDERIDFSLDFASQAEAESGTDNTRVMTALRVEQHFDAKRASDAEALAGSDTEKFTNSKQLHDNLKDAIGSATSGLSFGTNYQAASAGFVNAYVTGYDNYSQPYGDTVGYTDWSANPLTVVASKKAYYTGNDVDQAATIVFPVKKGDYWRVDTPTNGGRPSTMILRFVPFK